ncbi:MAG TPA: hypothetical protein VJ809_16565 [Pirellulales bacterium]|jgi:hypothetical protein|nr:hypothetical protein [Pirellulales bacterium]
MMKKLVLIVAAIAAACLVQETAKADHCGMWGMPWYTGYSREYIPYYSMHPPVYYSYPVPRAYGWSPWAYPPGTMTPEILGEMTGPQEIINPHVPPAPEAKPTSTNNKTTQHRAQQGPIPQVVLNPFVATKLAAE